MDPADTNPIAARFTTAAASYDREAGIQQRVAREIVRMLDDLQAPNPILEVGCGTGLMTEMLEDRFPQSELHAVDICGSMIEKARARLNNGRDIHWHVGDARSWGATRSFQLVTGSSVLHWLAPVDRSLQHLAALISEGGHIALGVMVEGTLTELHQTRRMVAPQKTGHNTLPSVTAVLAGLAAASLHVEVSRVVNLQNAHAGAEEFLKAIHAQGVTAGFYNADRLLNRSELARLVQVYDQHYRTADGSVRATYQVLLLRATK